MQSLNRKGKAGSKQAPPYLLCEAKAANVGVEVKYH